MKRAVLKCAFLLFLLAGCKKNEGTNNQASFSFEINGSKFKDGTPLIQYSPIYLGNETRPYYIFDVYGFTDQDGAGAAFFAGV